MDIAINKAKTTGIGWVTVKGSNHNGMAGFWAQKAADNGLIGMAFTNTSPLLAPTRSKQSALGTNPLSVVAPASQWRVVLLGHGHYKPSPLARLKYKEEKGSRFPTAGRKVQTATKPPTPN
ncbi:hypothetical protein ACJJTC_006486 [Scirpophaga incertulas]